MPCQTPIIVALDFPSRDAALALAGQLDPALCRVKVGKELFTRCGPPVVEALQAKGDADGRCLELCFKRISMRARCRLHLRSHTSENLMNKAPGRL